ncbi:12122_t:CDS:2, partial [Funneliformis geosporum]
SSGISVTLVDLAGTYGCARITSRDVFLSKQFSDVSKLAFTSIVVVVFSRVSSKVSFSLPFFEGEGSTSMDTTGSGASLVCWVGGISTVCVVFCLLF